MATRNNAQLAGRTTQEVKAAEPAQEIASEASPTPVAVGQADDRQQSGNNGEAPRQAPTLAQRRRDPDAIRRAFETGEYP